MARIQVKPLIKGFLPSHPIDGKIQSEPDENGIWSAWTADQFTFRLIQDGAIERVEEKAPIEEKAPAPDAAPAEEQSESPAPSESEEAKS